GLAQTDCRWNIHRGIYPRRRVRGGGGSRLLRRHRLWEDRAPRSTRLDPRPRGLRPFDTPEQAVRTTDTEPTPETNGAPEATYHGPLEGVRVIDRSKIIAGPYATMSLADRSPA